MDKVYLDIDMVNDRLLDHGLRMEVLFLGDTYHYLQ